MQFTTVALFFFAAMGAIANPVEADGLEAREEAGALITYTGCTKDGKKCTFDSVNKKVTCD
ncbi:Antifungal protein [Penicillium argentinense]|uniref:Antifungal protein n=1 Tax=Penicillium argentinense TaxID=1131581 RepID=A0A9W9FEZ2_9EURO|nr:Antifungal protein [Penicillium argentinense]KAJ5099003.1 Antifungal protein [Penicillium argentinense]